MLKIYLRFLFFFQLFCAGHIMANNIWPALTVHIKNTNELSKEYIVSTVLIPEADEAEFLKQFKIAFEGNSISLPLVIVSTELSRNRELLNNFPINSQNLFQFRLLSDGKEKFSFNDKRVSRKIASEISLEELQRFGTWVSVTGTGAFSIMFYLTSDVATATAATLVTAVLQVLSTRYASLVWDYMNNFGEVIQKPFQVHYPNLPLLHKSFYEVGKVNAAFVYNFLTQSIFMLSINLGDFVKTFIDIQQLQNIASVAAMGLFTSSSWELYFSKLHSGSDRDKKVALFMKYGKQLFMLSIAPFLYHPKTEIFATTFIVTFGAIGVSANFFKDPFRKISDAILTRIEKSSIISNALTELMSLKKRTGEFSFYRMRNLNFSNSCMSFLNRSTSP